MRYKTILCIILFCSCSVSLTGCGVVKEVDLWGFKTTFSDGLDLHVGMNGIDTVDNKRGINSKEGNYGKQTFSTIQRGNYAGQ